MRLVKQYLMAGAVAPTVLSLTACGSAAESRVSSNRPAEQAKAAAQQMPAAEQLVRVTDSQGTTLTLHLNGSPAAKDLCAQLPLDIAVENYSTNEKIFYPPKKLNTADTPMAKPKVGMVAYYAPWDDVVLFYAPLNGGELYELGYVEEDAGQIEKLSGTLHIEQVHP